METGFFSIQTPETKIPFMYLCIFFLNLIDPEGNDICQVYINGSIHQVGSVVCTYRGLDWRGHAGTQDI